MDEVNIYKAFTIPNTMKKGSSFQDQQDQYATSLMRILVFPLSEQLESHVCSMISKPPIEVLLVEIELLSKTTLNSK